MSLPSIKRLARRGGVKRCSDSISTEIRSVLKDFVSSVIQDSVQIIQLSGRKTITVMDILYALRRRGQTLYR